MTRKITWIDSEDIAISLSDRFPETDPLTVRFTDLHRWTLETENFDDEGTSSNEKKLEAIQMAWYEEWQERKAG